MRPVVVSESPQMAVMSNKNVRKGIGLSKPDFQLETVETPKDSQTSRSSNEVRGVNSTLEKVKKTVMSTLKNCSYQVGKRPQSTIAFAN
jgi:hypothetical protein